MSQSKATVCEYCGELPAMIAMKMAPRVLAVCERCRDSLMIRDAYEGRLVEIYDLSRRGDLQGALGILEGLRAAHAHEDHDGWLDFSLGSDAAMVLEEHGLREQALDWHLKLAARHASHPDRVLPNQLGTAIVLDKMGRQQEALAALDTGLAAATDDMAPDALGLLWRYAKIARQQGQRVPERYKERLAWIIQRCGLPLPLDFLRDPHLFEQVIIAAHAQWREANERLGSLQRSLREVTSRRSMEIVQEYCRNEPVGYFRELALRRLEGMAT